AGLGWLAGSGAGLDSGWAEGFPAGARARLLAARAYLAVAPAVVEVRRDVPLSSYDDTLPAEPISPQRLVELSERWGLDAPLNRPLAAPGPAARTRRPRPRPRTAHPALSPPAGAARPRPPPGRPGCCRSDTGRG